ncbi:MAG: nickel pincer cofactor biosynthesis protein LarB [Fibrobacterota bacterium]
MDIKTILKKYKNGLISESEAESELAGGGFEDLGFAKIDTARRRRCGFPEVIFCENKTPEQVREISLRIAESGQPLLATRAMPEVYQEVLKVLPEAEYNALSKTVFSKKGIPDIKTHGTIGIITAGTSDIPAAEEAAITAELMGNKIERIFDVGVAGIHRLFAHREKIKEFTVMVVAAGMEGALASVVGGLTDKPVIGLPTSVGYGAGAGGIAALLGMLNTCSSGVTVVNIDNGFGAGFAAGVINRI